MGHSQLQFDRRIRRLEKTASRRRNGVRYVVGPDGLVVAKARRRAPSFPLRGIMILAAAAMLFKAFLLVNLGGITYAERVAELQQGTVLEQAGAWIMQADPATIWIAEQIKSFL